MPPKEISANKSGIIIKWSLIATMIVSLITLGANYLLANDSSKQVKTNDLDVAAELRINNLDHENIKKSVEEIKEDVKEIQKDIKMLIRDKNPPRLTYNNGVIDER